MRALSGMSAMAGYAASMLLLAASSLVAIPAMIRASGEAAWGAIAVGQSIGAVAAVAIAYGWAMSGPAEVARGTASQRLGEFLASLKVRLTLLAPAVLVAAVAAALLAPSRPELAALGAAAAALVGLTANWFFVGLARPWVLLLVETLPRVAGTVIGIVLMTYHSSDAAVGLACQAAGFVAAFAGSAGWILAHLRGARAEATPRLATLLRERGAGLIAALGSAGYVAAPVMIVSAINPAVQPLYALVDKLQRQVSVALSPGVTVLQGWVPRGQPRRRARMGLLVSGLGALLIAAAVWLVGVSLLGWLGAGSLHPSALVTALMAVFVGLNFLESVVAKTVLATFQRLAAVARATLAGALIGLPLVALGALRFGAEGALAGVVTGLAARLAWELVVATTLLRRPNPESKEKS